MKINNYEHKWEKQKRIQKQYKLLRQRDCFNFENVFSWENVFDASINCQKGVKWKRKVQFFIIKRTANSINLSKQLLDGSYKKTPYMSFILNERGKRRLISGVSAFEDRIVMHLLCEKFLIPLLGNSFIYDNSASQKGKGFDFARTRFKKHMYSAKDTFGKNAAVVRFDFKNYFSSINSNKALSEIFKYVNSFPLIPDEKESIKKFYWLCKQYVCEEEGLGLGNQTSQVVAIWFMNRLDHFINEKLGYGLYARYMDDGYVFVENVTRGYEVLSAIQEFVSKFGLTLNMRKSYVSPINQGIIFLKNKYLLNGNYIKAQIARSTISYYIRHLKRLLHYCLLNDLPEPIFVSIQSFKGVCLRSDSGIYLWNSVIASVFAPYV